MSVWIDPDNITTITKGIKVHRDAALPPDDGEHDDLFSVDGGRVVLLGLVGHVTAAIPASSIDLDLHHDPDDGGSDVVLATALVTDSDPVGTMYTLNATAGGALVEELDVAYGVFRHTVVLQPGDIVLGVTGSGSIGTTARIEWTVFYIPLDEGATVSASESAPA